MDSCWKQNHYKITARVRYRLVALRDNHMPHSVHLVQWFVFKHKWNILWVRWSYTRMFNSIHKHPDDVIDTSAKTKTLILSSVILIQLILSLDWPPKLIYFYSTMKHFQDKARACSGAYKTPYTNMREGERPRVNFSWRHQPLLSRKLICLLFISASVFKIK